jgi:hypothetical protein
MFDGVVRALSALHGAEAAPRRVRDRHTEQRDQWGEVAAQVFVEGEELAGDLFANDTRLVTLFDLEIRA